MLGRPNKAILMALTPDREVLTDREPSTDYLLESEKLGLAYGLSDPVPILDWSRSELPGGQPDPATGALIWLKTGADAHVEKDPEDDNEYWDATEAVWIAHRNGTVEADASIRSPFLKLLQGKMLWVSIGFVAFSALFHLLKMLT